MQGENGIPTCCGITLNAAVKLGVGQMMRSQKGFAGLHIKPGEILTAGIGKVGTVHTAMNRTNPWCSGSVGGGNSSALEENSLAKLKKEPALAD